MKNFETTKQVHKGPFKTRELARADARAFARVGGTVIGGGRYDTQGNPTKEWHWYGRILVEDTNKNIEGNFGCRRCALTGNFITGMLNGQPVGPGGVCFRCNGKGYHTQEDRVRNEIHDRLAICSL